MASTDLNHIRTFLELYEQQSVSAAADRLHVTQPTVSYTLKRLREHYGDELFTREGHRMVPTAKAHQLFGPLHSAVAQIDATTSDQQDFNPKAFTGELMLGLTSIGEQTFLPPIMSALAEASSMPQMNVERLDAEEVEDGIVRGKVDLAVTVSMIESPRLWRSHVRAVEYVALVSSAHPLPRTSPTMFRGRRFLRVSARGGHVFPLQALSEHELMSQVALTVEEYATVPAVLESTDLVVLLPRHVAEVFQRWFPALDIVSLPWPAQSSPVSLYSRREENLTSVQRWFRSLALEAIAESRESLKLR